jgi:hypothetical protein
MVIDAIWVFHVDRDRAPRYQHDPMATNRL